jgi:signal transduction histidine kinase
VRFVADAPSADPPNAAAYRARGVRIIIAAPITAGAKRLGALAVYSAHAPVFAQDDMELVQLLADQAAVILESRALIDEAARIRAQEQATRLKEDFLSAAAHDLRTPLTTIIGQAQALERRARRDAVLASELPGIERLVRESIRLRDLVAELLDASRMERGALVGELEPADIGTLVDDAARRRATEERVVRVNVERGLVTLCDPRRIEQVVENLVENALKFSPPESPVEVRAWRQDGEARVLVSDHGIGIPAGDLPHVFERFRRGSNVDDRRFAGMGLGLYICRGIVEQHGGRIWVESRLGEGASFHVALPLAAISPRAEVLN